MCGKAINNCSKINNKVLRIYFIMKTTQIIENKVGPIENQRHEQPYSACQHPSPMGKQEEKGNKRT